MKIQIKNARVVDPGSGLDEKRDVFIAAGKVAEKAGQIGHGGHRGRISPLVCKWYLNLAL